MTTGRAIGVYRCELDAWRCWDPIARLAWWVQCGSTVSEKALGPGWKPMPRTPLNELAFKKAWS